MKKFLTDETGNVIAFTAITMFVLIGFMSLGIDVGTMMVARNQLQTAADAAALAGASGLVASQGEATNRAIYFAADNWPAIYNCLVTGLQYYRKWPWSFQSLHVQKQLQQYDCLKIQGGHFQQRYDVL